MGRSWGRQWPEYRSRPKVAKLSAEKRGKIIEALERERDKSPVLVGLGVEVKSRRGRFYLERADEEEPEEPFQIGRLTPLAGHKRTTLLLEVEFRSWKEIERGGAAKVMKAVSGDRNGTFHGMGALDTTLRKRGTERQELTCNGAGYKYPDGTLASVQEVLYHLGVPLHVVAEPSGWYECHRHPHVVEMTAGCVLVEFSAVSLRGGRFGGRCLYAKRKGVWDAYTVRPNASESIDDAAAWLEKRGWEAW